MFRQPLRNGFENGSTLELLGVRLVIEVGRSVERDGVRDLSLIVVWIVNDDLFLRITERA